MKSFEELDVWKEGCRLAVDVYRSLAECRDYGMKDQITRAAVSIPSNIAEGAERHTDRELVSFLYIAKGSCAELRTQLYLADRIGLLPHDRCAELIAACKRISGMLQNLITYLQSKHS